MILTTEPILFDSNSVVMAGGVPSSLNNPIRDWKISKQINWQAAR